MAGANTLVYYDKATITSVKSYIVQVPEGEGAVVEHLPYHLEAQGSSPSTTGGNGREKLRKNAILKSFIVSVPGYGWLLASINEEERAKKVTDV